MLSDHEKQEMLEDAQSDSRRRDFSKARERSLKPISGPEYLQFLKNMMSFFPQELSPHKITGEHFKL